MVFFFTAEGYTIYIGTDKYENEELLKAYWPEDVWFHVDNLSSAHVYLRLKPGESIDDIPDDVLNQCCYLVKHNSIQGIKEPQVSIVYTMASNLLKTGDMAVGQVSYKAPRQVLKKRIEGRANDLVRQLEKTKRKVELTELWSEKEEREAEKRKLERERIKTQKKYEDEARAERTREAERRSYSTYMAPGKMTSNKYGGGGDDDFM